MSKRIAGVVSNKPAYLMNQGLNGGNVVTVALMGRVPCKVRGSVAKGDLLVSDGTGYAVVNNNPVIGSVIGKSLANWNGTNGVVEVVVGVK
jgi:hypothetical protein